MWGKVQELMETIPPWLSSRIKLLLWWGALCSLLLLLIIARQCNTYRIATFGAHRISQTLPTAPTDIKNSKVTAKPLLFTPTAQQLRFAVAIDTTGEEKSTLTITEVSLTDNRKKQYRFPAASIGNLNMWEQESLEPALLQDGKTALVMLFFAPPVPDEAGLEFFRLKFVATLEHVGKKNKRGITKYPFQLDIKKAEIERLHAFNLMPRAAGMHDGLERFKAHIRHFRRDLAGTVYVYFVSIWGALGTLLAVWLFFKWRAQGGERRYSGSHLDDWEPPHQRRAAERRMKHYRLVLALMFLLCTGIGVTVLLVKTINRRGAGEVVKSLPPSSASSPISMSTPTPPPTPPSPAPTPTGFIQSVQMRLKQIEFKYCKWCGTEQARTLPFKKITKIEANESYGIQTIINFEREGNDRTPVSFPVQIMFKDPFGKIYGLENKQLTSQHGDIAGIAIGTSLPSGYIVGTYTVEVHDGDILVGQESFEIIRDPSLVKAPTSRPMLGLKPLGFINSVKVRVATMTLGFFNSRQNDPANQQERKPSGVLGKVPLARAKSVYVNVFFERDDSAKEIYFPLHMIFKDPNNRVVYDRAQELAMNESQLFLEAIYTCKPPDGWVIGTYSIELCEGSNIVARASFKIVSE